MPEVASDVAEADVPADRQQALNYTQVRCRAT